MGLTEIRLAFVLLIIAAYLIGNINTSVILAKFVFHTDDIENSDSGKFVVYTIAGNMLKGITAVLLGVLIQEIFFYTYDMAVEPMIFDETFLSYERDTDLWFLLAFPYAAGLFVITGHMFPVFSKFRGGKGVAISAAVILSLPIHCIIGFAVAVIALIVIIISRYVSPGVLIGAVLYPLIVLVFFIKQPWYCNLLCFVFALLTAALSIAKHSSNIKRLLKGEENKLGAKKHK